MRETHYWAWSATATAALLVALVATPAIGIVVSDDPALHEVAPGLPHGMIGTINSAGDVSGVLIGPWHVLTARHALPSAQGKSFRMDLEGGPQSYDFDEVYPHPTADLAVGVLSTPSPLPGYGLYTASNEVGQEAALLGYGMSGVGRPVVDYPRGRLRIGHNVIDIATSSALGCDFDEPSSTGPQGSLGAGREAIQAAGDSGGALLILDEDQWRLAGIHWAVLDADDDGVFSDYGDWGYAVRVSAFADWVQGVLDAFTVLPGDANRDGQVTDADYAIWADNYGTKGATWSTGDFNADGLVTDADYAIWADNYNLDAPAPEPTAALLLPAFAALLRRRRSR
jgi:Trypsin